ncbi:MAG TPA: winged helix-turn-helix domain-containing protein, partial [Vicinamibacterales bacterium]|nr:winged helix-turn-helix domain-containing protein [Vicinamibacterales bacterium]
MSLERSSPTQLVAFGTFEVDLRSGELRKAGVRVPLQEQPRRVLARLLRNAGELVTRDELRQELWPDNTFLDFEHGLNAAIKRLRDALGDAADTPRFIETLPRRGYRFIAPVEIRGGASEPAPPPRDRTPPASMRARWLGVSILLAFLAAIAAAAWWYRASLTSPRSPPPDVAAPEPAGVLPRRVGVAAFENRSTDPALDSLGDQVAGRIVRAIAQVPGVEARPETAAARAAGASLLVTGAL